jgi:hypothetical protein
MAAAQWQEHNRRRIGRSPTGSVAWSMRTARSPMTQPRISSADVRLVAREWHEGLTTMLKTKAQVGRRYALTWAFVVERVRGIEPPSRAWEQRDSGRTEPLSSGSGWPWLAVRDHGCSPRRARRGHGVGASCPSVFADGVIVELRARAASLDVGLQRAAGIQYPGTRDSRTMVVVVGG